MKHQISVSINNFQIKRINLFITSRKRSCERVMFSHLSVSHSVHGEGMCIPACTGQGGVCLWQSPWADIPMGRHLPGRHPQLGRHPLTRDGHCSGGYASYWNVFLFNLCIRGLFNFQLVLILVFFLKIQELQTNFWGDYLVACRKQGL